MKTSTDKTYRDTITLIAFGFGQVAFQNGKKCIPAHDANVLRMIGENDGYALPILNGWLAGWTAENLKG